MPGQRLFQYVNADGRRQSVTSDDVNDYLRRAMGGDFTAKDFRTWAGTVLAAKALRAVKLDATQRPPERSLVLAVEDVARRLGNTPAVCRRCYIHPAVIDAHLDGSLRTVLADRAARELAVARRLRADERRLLHLLRNRLRAGRQASSSAAA